MKRLLTALSAVTLVVTASPAAVAQSSHSVAHEKVAADDGTQIAISIFTPAAAATTQVPVILHSHGWAGSRQKTIGGAVKTLLDAGFGVVSIDQRGHGESGGKANVQDPTLETEDIKNVIDRVAALDWVLHDADAYGLPIANDPVLGAIGGSYGGGYQTMTALDEIADDGRTRFNALAPEITWYDLPESLAPQKVVRTAWNVLLYSVGARMLPNYIHEAFVWGTATGQWPDGTLYDQPAPGVPNLDREFHEHSPVAFVEKGVRIDVPVLLRQGTSDNLFNLNEGLKIFDHAVTDEARAQSYLVAYNGGHALPNALPPGTAAGSDACSPDGFTNLTIDFFRRVFGGTSTEGLLPARYNLTTADGSKCLSLDEIGVAREVDVNLLGSKTLVTTAAAGAPIHVPVAEGPVTVTGIPTLEGKLTSTGLDSRAFFGLAVGSSPADAKVIQHNLMPLRQVLPATSKGFAIELPGVSVEVPEGQSLFLTISPVSDIYFGHASRVPAALVLSDLTVALPGVAPTCEGDKDNGKGEGHAHGHDKKACGEKKKGKGAR
ncbi:MAG TPA: alpha/beta fold hydrolase [Actinomycetota bacterium]|nr:alpha/beta fold hydrolase [Actinomycetota bacterium]